MRQAYWIGLVVVALLVGLAAGYGLWGSDASQVADLQAKVDQLSQENADLKAKPSVSASAEPADGTPAPSAAASSQSPQS